MTVLVQQRTPHDCGPCCLAMLTGRDYEDVVKVIGDAFTPSGDRPGLRDEAEALTRLGYTYKFKNGELTADSNFVNRSRGWEISPEYFRSEMWGRRALVSVPSLNFPGKLHMVFWDGARIWDPSVLKVYIAFNELLPKGLVLFREAPSCV